MERLEGNRIGLARLWRNPSVRHLSVILAVFFLLAVIFIALYSHYSTGKLKQDWLDREAAMLGNLSEVNPELAEIWISQLTEVEAPSPESVAAGRKLLENSGLKAAALETSWLPIVGHYQTRTFWVLFGATVTFLTCLAVLLFRENRRQFGEIRSLAISLEDTVKHNRPMAYRIYDEGDIGLLANGAQELTIRLRETIEQLHRDKSFLKDTIADISHQLKTPLASLMIYIDLLQEGQADAVHSAEFLRTCRQELDRMEWLTLSLLKLARLEADALELNLRNDRLAETVNRAVQSIAGYAENKGVSITVEESDVGFVLPHDSHWLMEAIANLIKNAVEHSPAGSAVAIGWEITPAFVRMHVKDQGRGIEPRHLPHIFQKFYRSSSEGSGVGLGLPLAKSIVEKHGGLLSAAANPAGGTIFYLSLPLHPLPDKPLKLTEL